MKKSNKTTVTLSAPEVPPAHDAVPKRTKAKASEQSTQLDNPDVSAVSADETDETDAVDQGETPDTADQLALGAWFFHLGHLLTFTPAPLAVPVTQSTVMGSVVMGPVISGHQLSVHLFMSDGLTPLANPVRVGSDGNYAITITGYSGVIKAKLIDGGTGADFKDEATGANKDVNAEFWAVGTVASGGTVTLNINPLTTLAFKKLGANPTAAQVDAALAAVETAFGLTAGSLKSTTPIATNSDGWAGADKNSAAAKLGMALATLSGLDALNGGNMAKTIDDLAEGLGTNGTLTDGAKNQLLAGAAQASSKVDGINLVQLMATSLGVADRAGSIAAISGTATQGLVLTAGTITDPDGGVTDVSYQWRANGVDIAGATNSTFTLTPAQVGKAITVVATYSDILGTGKRVTSAPTATVVDIDDPGSITIIGDAEEGQELWAGAIIDADGGVRDVTYQWQANGVHIDGQTGDRLRLTQAQTGQVITVVATYSDAHGTGKRVTSAPTASVSDIDFEGVIHAIRGTPTEGEVLTAGKVMDPDGGVTGLAYQWQADGTDIVGANGSTLVLTQAQVGKVITVVATYSDIHGTGKRVTSAPTAAVLDIDDPGSITIIGDAEEGQELWAGAIIDADGGVRDVTYQWQADGVDIDFATDNSLFLDGRHVGKVITVVATYADNHGGGKRVVSAPTGPVADVDDPGTIRLAIDDTDGRITLSVSAIEDSDGGVTGVTYQWFVDGQTIDGATNSTFTLRHAHSGLVISAAAYYTDNHGSGKVAVSMGDMFLIPPDQPPRLHQRHHGERDREHRWHGLHRNGHAGRDRQRHQLQHHRRRRCGTLQHPCRHRCGELQAGHGPGL